MKCPRSCVLVVTVLCLGTVLTAQDAIAQAGQTRPDLRLCNDAGTRAAVTMVRTTGMLGGVTENAWQAEGPFLISNGECRDIYFGAMQALQQGYLSIQLARKTAAGERWSAPQYEIPLEDRNDKKDGPRFEVLSPIVTMCLPYSNTTIVSQLGSDPFAAKPPCREGWGPAPFNVWFFTHGEATTFAITLTDTGFRQSINVRSTRYF